VRFRLYQGMWRYVGIWDIRNIVGGVASSSVLFFMLVHYGFGETSYPRSIFVIDSLLLVCSMVGLRLLRRLYREFGWDVKRRHVLIYGAGDAGEMISREMQQNLAYEGKPVGFIDDDPRKSGRWIHGLQVLGTRARLSEAILKKRADEVLVAIPSATSAIIRDIVKALEPFEVQIKTLPNLQAAIGGRVNVAQIRTLSVEDLLTRRAVGLDDRPVKALVGGRRVLVTGAGGSIGSELCRQVASLQPSQLVLYDRYENSLHAIATELADKSLTDTVPVIGDVTDWARLDEILARYRPQILFHAAAHKHVPLMEGSPCEAVKNNVTGTRLTAEGAEKHGVERFIFVSTDKAVSPTSVMGATKRVAELLLQVRAPLSSSSYYTVRFGNVLASNGSVVPRFLEQIQTGGPLTLTHPDMHRYFMLISEAVQLVLHAAAQDRADRIYVLQMGEQVSVLKLARNLIRLSGLVPNRDIQIVFSGVRSGEKLQEELVCADEVVEPSAVDGILQVRAAPQPDPENFQVQLAALERLALENDASSVLRQLRVIVSDYGKDENTESGPTAATA